MRGPERRPAQHRILDAVIVDGVTDRLPAFLHRQRLVEFRLLRQSHIDEIEALQRVETHVLVALERRDLFRDQVERGIDVAAADSEQLRRAIADMANDDAFERQLAAPVILVAHELDLRVALPARDLIGAGAGGLGVEPRRGLVLFLGVCVGGAAIRFHHLALHGDEFRRREHVEDRLRRILQDHIDGALVDRRRPSRCCRYIAKADPSDSSRA